MRGYTTAEIGLFESQARRAANNAEIRRRYAAACERQATEQSQQTSGGVIPSEAVQEFQRRSEIFERVRKRHRATALPRPSSKAGCVVTCLDSRGRVMAEGSETVSIPEYLQRYHRYRDEIMFLEFMVSGLNDFAIFVTDAKEIRRVTGWHLGSRNRLLRLLGFKPRPARRI